MNGELRRRSIWWMLAAMLGGATLLLSLPATASAQGCAMCYQTAAASAAPAREALRYGILILLVPAASLFVGILGYLWRRNSAS